MTQDDSDSRTVTRREFAKQQRRAAYQAAKARRAADPRYLALKEVAKERRRAAYQELKRRRKAEATEAKTREKTARQAEHERERALSEVQLMQLVRWGGKGSSVNN